MSRFGVFFSGRRFSPCFSFGSSPNGSWPVSFFLFSPAVPVRCPNHILNEMYWIMYTSCIARHCRYAWSQDTFRLKRFNCGRNEGDTSVTTLVGIGWPHLTQLLQWRADVQSERERETERFKCERERECEWGRESERERERVENTSRGQIDQ